MAGAVAVICHPHAASDSTWLDALSCHKCKSDNSVSLLFVAWQNRIVSHCSESSEVPILVMLKMLNLPDSFVYIPKASSSSKEETNPPPRNQTPAELPATSKPREGGRERGGWGSARVSAGRRRRRSRSGGRRRTGASRRTPAPRLPRPRRGGKPSQSPNHPPGPPAGI